jgi:hypothetical protein
MTLTQVIITLAAILTIFSAVIEVQTLSVMVSKYPGNRFRSYFMCVTLTLSCLILGAYSLSKVFE